MPRRPLSGPHPLVDSPVLDEFGSAGASDHLAFLVEFRETTGSGMVTSWTADRPGGFSDARLAALTRVQRLLAIACKMALETQIARNVATACPDS